MVSNGKLASLSKIIIEFEFRVSGPKDLLIRDHAPEVGIYKRKQESKKTRKQEKKQELDQESGQEKSKFFSFFLVAFLVGFLFSCFLDRFLDRVLVLFYKFLPQMLRLVVETREFVA